MKDKWKNHVQSSCYNCYFMQEIYIHWQKKKLLWTTWLFLNLGHQSWNNQDFGINCKISFPQTHCDCKFCEVRNMSYLSLCSWALSNFPSRITYSCRIRYLSLHMSILVGITCISLGTTRRQDLLHLWVPRNNHCDWYRE